MNELVLKGYIALKGKTQAVTEKIETLVKHPAAIEDDGNFMTENFIGMAIVVAIGVVTLGAMFIIVGNSSATSGIVEVLKTKINALMNQVNA